MSCGMACLFPAFGPVPAGHFEAAECLLVRDLMPAGLTEADKVTGAQRIGCFSVTNVKVAVVALVIILEEKPPQKIVISMSTFSPRVRCVRW